MSYGNNSHNLKQNNNYIWWIRQKHKDATNIQIQTEREVSLNGVCYCVNIMIFSYRTLDFACFNLFLRVNISTLSLRIMQHLVKGETIYYILYI